MKDTTPTISENRHIEELSREIADIAIARGAKRWPTGQIRDLIETWHKSKLADFAEHITPEKKHLPKVKYDPVEAWDSGYANGFNAAIDIITKRTKEYLDV